MVTAHHLWTAIWPNLAANVVWVPVVFWWQHNRMVKRVAEIHRRHSEELREHVTAMRDHLLAEMRGTDTESGG